MLQFQCPLFLSSSFIYYTGASDLLHKFLLHVIMLIDWPRGVKLAMLRDMSQRIMTFFPLSGARVGMASA